MKLDFHKKIKVLSLKDLKTDGEKKNYKKQILIGVIIVGIFIRFFSGVSLGKAIHNTKINTNTEIAKPILEVEKGSEINITEDNQKGEYTFKVKNYNDLEEISEVDLKYFIEILENDLDTSIQYTLYKEGEEIELKDNKTEEIKLSKDKKEEQIYILEVEYDSTKNKIGNIMKDIQIKVHSEQLEI